MKTRKTLPTLLAAVTLVLAAAPALAAGVVNVNKADASQLALLPRVGPALAGRILEFREENGKFERVEDLMLVRGIGEKTVELLAPFVTTTGETTLASKVSLADAEKAASQPRKSEEKKDDKKQQDDKKKDAKDGEDAGND